MMPYKVYNKSEEFSTTKMIESISLEEFKRCLGESQCDRRSRVCQILIKEIFKSKLSLCSEEMEKRGLCNWRGVNTHGKELKYRSKANHHTYFKEIKSPVLLTYQLWNQEVTSQIGFWITFCCININETFTLMC